MKSIHARFLFNSIIFLLLGIVSIIRTEMLETVISFTFFGIFLSLTVLIKRDSNEYLV